MRSITIACWTVWSLSIFAAAEPALAGDSFILATGRRDPRIYAIDFNVALRTANDRTPNAIVSRSKTQADRLDGVPVGDPANIVLSEDQKTAYVVNHHGAINNAEFLQHGGRSSIAVMDVQKLIDKKYDNTDAALNVSFDGGYFGGVGLLLLPDLLIVSHSENWLTEDGSNVIAFVDRRTGSRRGEIQMALGHPNHPCPDFPVPFVSPTAPPVVPLLSPDPNFGCWPNPEIIDFGIGSDGRTYLFSGNGGTPDVSVMDLQSALKGNPVVEVAPRIPIQFPSWGIKASPNRKLIAVVARDDGQTTNSGNTVSIIDVDRARTGSPGAEAARVLVGTDDPTVQSRPFTVTWTPDGRDILVANYNTNNVSIVDVTLALAHNPHPEVARIPLTRLADPDGIVRPANPKGTAISSDGHYLVVSGGQELLNLPPSGTVSIIDLQKRAVVATVTGVGDDPYGLTILGGSPN